MWGQTLMVPAPMWLFRDFDGEHHGMIMANFDRSKTRSTPFWDDDDDDDDDDLTFFLGRFSLQATNYGEVIMR